MSKRLARTQQVEMVETHNLALCFKRLTGSPYSIGRWKRALYHALSMDGCLNRDELMKIREALGLP